MLAYMLVRELKHAWRGFDLTVEEGLDELNRIYAVKVSISDKGSILKVPEPSKVAKESLDALSVSMPVVLPKSKIVVDTKKKLAECRKDD